MSFVADVKLSWKRSASADITARRLTIVKNGEESVIELGAEVSEFMIAIPASSSVTFKTDVIDSDGKTVSSEVYSFTVGDLVDPLPDTELFHEIVAVREVV